MVVYTVFHKKALFFLLQFSEMTINLHEIFNRCNQKILIQNIWTKYGFNLDILC